MADQTSDDVYDDVENILADTDDTVDGATELPAGEAGDLSQSIYSPEAAGDTRGPLDLGDAEAEYEPGISRDNGLDAGDGDANHVGEIADEQDGTES